MTQSSHEERSLYQVTSSCLAEQIIKAQNRLSCKVIRTPTIQLHWMGSNAHRVWAKLECQQETGSFKYRGALNALLMTAAPTIVTASAGNHALAICRAAKVVGKTSKIIVPVTVSELKANRILAEADEVIFYGNDLAEATREAIRIEKAANICDRTGHPAIQYISPYDDLEVAAGAGTLISEAFEDAGPFDQVIVPLGGGGLTAAVASWCRTNAPSTKVICVHPKIFCRSLEDGANRGITLSHMLHQPTQATLCDGLAVQLVRPTQFADILDSLVDKVVEVSEDSVLMGIASVLRYQSLLLEGSSAAAISSISHGPLHDLKGRTLVLLTGGNLSSNNIARALTAQVADPIARQKMGLRNVTNPADRNGALDDLARKAPVEALPVLNGSAAALSKNGLHVSHMTPEIAPEDLMDALCHGLRERVATFQDLVQQRSQLSSQLGLDVDRYSEGVLENMVSIVQRMVIEFNDAIQRKEPLWVLEERYRTLIVCFAAAESMGERASASNDQAKRQWFFRTTAQHQSACNYDRYGVDTLRDAELMFLRSTMSLSSQSVGNDRLSVTLLLASSGMAAFQIVWQYVMHQLRPGDSITLPPYIYFEAMEQIVSMNKMINVNFAPGFHADQIICTAEETGARVVFIDPVANVVGLPCTDLRAFFKRVAGRPGWENRIVVVDGTMISGGLSVFDWVSSSERGPMVLYHESASKYAQLGLDIQMAGFCVAPSRLDEPLRKIRRDTGGVLSRHGVACLPSLTPKIYEERLQMLTRNAESVYYGLKERISHVAKVAFPESWRELGWRHGGALVTVEFLNAGLNNREGLEACIDLVLRTSTKVGLPITKGVSFGFSTSRISASSSMAENTDPFLRISVGISHEHVPILTAVVAQEILTYVNEFGIAKE
ncbi:pyridoxal-5'-phosphate-dependent protein beta subunit [Colletotrichum orchidophilum]|uniref:Pyridoxal-5'-phosphate-dependent protein beta subunit n=1 Tax=Colletotrichum orchidophilum TaxID=1209926 RepID=A0A1G4BDA5_9PEZI|nr:pyridoxal-5'-phosphate-dependent protein beta subunit [Colletotrichum orchidophilum]OHE99335.1 pyridoxal-5'-phosphate-dependent protein beta subunit [Colletotrichum orchidophilum]